MKADATTTVAPGRHETVLRQYMGGVCDLQVVERYILRMTTDDGTIIRHDDKDLWLMSGCSWYGLAPDTWDASKAVAEDHCRMFEEEVDYS